MTTPSRYLRRLSLIPVELLSLFAGLIAVVAAPLLNAWVWHSLVNHKTFPPVTQFEKLKSAIESYGQPVEGFFGAWYVMVLLTSAFWLLIAIANHYELWNAPRSDEQWAEVSVMPLGRWFVPQLLLVPLVVSVPITCLGLPSIACALGMLAASLVWAITFRKLEGDPKAPRHRRGTKLLDEETARAKTGRPDPRNNRTLRWGPLVLPDGEEHFCAIGAPGTGKTLSLAYLLESVIEHYKNTATPNIRLVLYDAKGDAYSWLRSFGVAESDIKFLNPFDERSYSWDMAKDITTEGVAQEVAEILIQGDAGDANIFFTKAARDLFGAVLVALMYAAPGNWDLRDAVLTLRYPKALRKLLTSCPTTDGYVQEYLNLDPRTLSGITATISTALALLRPVAAMWSRSRKEGRVLSLREWATTKGVIVLGGSEELVATINSINRVLFSRLTQLLLQGPEDTTANQVRTWVFIDELKEAGRLEGLARLLNKGRSKGVRIALAFQDLNGLMASYGQLAATEFPDLCSNKIYCQVNSGHTADWICSQNIGHAEILEYQRSYAAHSPSEVNISEQISTRIAVMKEEIQHLPTARNGVVSAYVQAKSVGTFKTTVDYFGRTPPLTRKEPRFEKDDFRIRDAEHQRLLPWDDADKKRLGLVDDDLSQSPTATPTDSDPFNPFSIDRQITSER